MPHSSDSTAATIKGEPTVAALRGQSGVDFCPGADLRIRVERSTLRHHDNGTRAFGDKRPRDMGTPSRCQPNDYLEAVTARREPVAIAANAFEIIRVTAAKSDIGRCSRRAATPSSR